MFETLKSGNTISSGEIGLNIRTNASPEWDRTRSPELSSVGMLHPLQMFYGNLAQLGKNSIKDSMVQKNNIDCSFKPFDRCFAPYLTGWGIYGVV